MASNDATVPQKPDPFFSGTVYEIKGWRRWLLIWPGTILFRLYCATLRVETDPESERVISDTSRPAVCIFWHNRSFIIPLVLRRYRDAGKSYCLISASKAAAWENAIYNTLGIPSVRGSSTRRSIHAMLELVHLMGKGNDIVIAPDGPSGPRYEFRRGAVAAARMTKSPIILAGIECKASWRPKTWDRQIYPLPFSKVRIRAKMLENAAVFDGNDDDKTICKRLAGQLRSLNEDYGV